MNNDNIQSYFTNVSNTTNTINVMLDIMLSQERTLNSLLTTQQRPIRNVSRTIPVRSTNSAYTPNTTHLRRPRDFVLPQHFNIPTTQNLEQNINNLARQIVTSALFNIDNLTPVVVRPTNRQIQNATSEVIFNTIIQPYNNTCPITQQPFQQTDNVLRINQCGHLFTPNELRRWFNSSVICPLCRIDIRDSVAETQNAIPVQPQINNPIEYINQDINNIFSNVASDAFGNMFYEYTILQPRIVSNTEPSSTEPISAEPSSTGPSSAEPISAEPSSTEP